MTRSKKCRIKRFDASPPSELPRTQIPDLKTTVDGHQIKDYKEQIHSADMQQASNGPSVQISNEKHKIDWWIG